MPRWFEKDRKPERGHWKLDNGARRKLEAGKARLEAVKWRLHGTCKMVPGDQYPVHVRPISDVWNLPEGPGNPLLKYIRSGPEGARGVLKGRGWSLCMCLSEVPSFRLSAFCCPSLLPDPGLPGRKALFLLGALGRTSVFQLFFRIGFWKVF